MPKTRQQKEEIKAALVENLKKSSSVVFADYQGLNVPQADELRKKMHEGAVKYMVAKKTLINLAAKEAGIELDAKQLPGMIGVAFGSDDEIAPAKILGDIAKDTSLKLVGGIFEGAAVDQNYVISLSKLPGREQLYAMFLNVINGPVSGFVRTLDAIRTKKEEEEGAPAPAAEAPKAEEEPKPEEAPAPAEKPKAEEKPAEETPAPAEETPKTEEAPAEAPVEESPKE